MIGTLNSLVFLILFFCNYISAEKCMYQKLKSSSQTSPCSQIMNLIFLAGWQIDIQATIKYNKWENNSRVATRNIKNGIGDCVVYKTRYENAEDCCSGWTGQNCEIATCSSPCVHGVCTGPNTCTCLSPWSGQSCDERLEDVSDTARYCYTGNSCKGEKLYNSSVISKDDCCRSNTDTSWGYQSVEGKDDDCSSCKEDELPLTVIPGDKQAPFRTCVAGLECAIRTFDGVTYRYCTDCTLILVNTPDVVITAFPECDADISPLCHMIVTVKSVYRQRRYVTSNDSVAMFEEGHNEPLEVIRAVDIQQQAVRLGELNVNVIGDNFFMTLPRFDIRVRLDKSIQVSVTVGKNSLLRNGEMGGACGNYDNNVTDEIKLAKNQQEATTFGRLYTEETCTHRPTEPCQNEERKRAAEQACSVLSSVLFKTCHPLVATQPYIQSCMQSYCFSDDRDSKQEEEARCDAIGAYANMCALDGVIINWRNEKLCPRQCKNNMVYRQCGPACKPTCGHPISSYLRNECDLCCPGCHCPDGLVLHNGTCIQPTQCPCVYKGTAYDFGDTLHIDETCQTCICGDFGHWTCTLKPCTATCSVYGPGVVTTFDGEEFVLGSHSHTETCGYTLVSVLKSVLEIKLIAHLCDKASTAMCTKGFILKTDSQHFAIEFSVTGTFAMTDLQMNRLHDLPLFVDGVYVRQTSFNSIVADFHDFRVIFYAHGYLAISTEESRYFGLIQGLCGNLNNLITDERLLPSGVQAFSDDIFAAAFSENECGLIAPLTQITTNERQCSVLRQLYEKFNQTSDEVENIYRVCVYHGDHKSICSAVLKLAVNTDTSLVSLLNYPLSDAGILQTCATELTICKDGLTYQEDIEICDSNCLDLALGEEKCQKKTIQGCSCADGFYRSQNGTCVPKNQCPCLHIKTGKYYNPGKVDGIPCHECKCEYGKLSCEEKGCENIVCPKNQVADFTTKTSSGECRHFKCPNKYANKVTCSDNGSPIRKCLCEKGYTMTAFGTCVSSGCCPCYHDAIWHDHGDHIMDNCYHKRCENGVWNIVEKTKCEATCILAGAETRIETFDGSSYSLYGTTSYTLIKTQGSSQGFKISFRNLACEGADVACSQKLDIRFKGIHMELLSGIGVLVGNKTFPFENDVPLGDIKVMSTTLFTVVNFLGVTIYWSGGLLTWIRVSNRWENKLEGLCGTYDYNSKNDFYRIDGSLVTDVGSFVTSWQEEDVTETHLRELTPCENDPERKTWSCAQCSIIKTLDAFQRCRDAMPQSHVDRYVSDCEKSICHCKEGSSSDCICNTMTHFAAVCENLGHPVRWRHQHLCPAQCEGGMVYSTSERPCRTTCLDLANNFTHCDIAGRVEGCFCPPGKMWHESRCIPPNQCPCYDGMNMIEPGAVQRKRCEVCVCEAGKLHCTATNCTECLPTEFKCTTSGNCIHQSDVCDNIFNCYDGSDEDSELCDKKNCTAGQFQCKSGECIFSSKLCDRIIHCADGSDEDQDICKYDCEYTCENGKCLHNDSICDGYFDCIDGADERDCNKVCDHGFFKCNKSGQCIPENRLCDGHDDCGDGVDEFGCTSTGMETSTPMPTSEENAGTSSFSQTNSEIYRTSLEMSTTNAETTSPKLSNPHVSTIKTSPSLTTSVPTSEETSAMETTYKETQSTKNTHLETTELFQTTFIPQTFPDSKIVGVRTYNSQKITPPAIITMAPPSQTNPESTTTGTDRSNLETSTNENTNNHVSVITVTDNMGTKSSVKTQPEILTRTMRNELTTNSVNGETSSMLETVNVVSTTVESTQTNAPTTRAYKETSSAVPVDELTSQNHGTTEQSISTHEKTAFETLTTEAIVSKITHSENRISEITSEETSTNEMFAETENTNSEEIIPESTKSHMITTLVINKEGLSTNVPIEKTSAFTPTAEMVPETSPVTSAETQFTTNSCDEECSETTVAGEETTNCETMTTSETIEESLKPSQSPSTNITPFTSSESSESVWTTATQISTVTSIPNETIAETSTVFQTSLEALSSIETTEIPSTSGVSLVNFNSSLPSLRSTGASLSTVIPTETTSTTLKTQTETTSVEMFAETSILAQTTNNIFTPELNSQTSAQTSSESTTTMQTTIRNLISVPSTPSQETTNENLTPTVNSETPTLTEATTTVTIAAHSTMPEKKIETTPEVFSTKTSSVTTSAQEAYETSAEITIEAETTPTKFKTETSHETTFEPCLSTEATSEVPVSLQISTSSTTVQETSTSEKPTFTSTNPEIYSSAAAISEAAESTSTQISSGTSVLTPSSFEMSTSSKLTTHKNYETFTSTEKGMETFPSTLENTETSKQTTKESSTSLYTMSEISTSLSTSSEAPSTIDTGLLTSAKINYETSISFATSSEISAQTSSETSTSAIVTSEAPVSMQTTSETSTLAQVNAETSVSVENTSEISTSCQSTSETSPLVQETSEASMLAETTTEISTSSLFTSKISTLVQETPEISTEVQVTSETIILAQTSSYPETSVSYQTSTETSASARVTSKASVSSQTMSDTSISTQTTSETSILAQTTVMTPKFAQTTSNTSVSAETTTEPSTSSHSTSETSTFAQETSDTSTLSQVTSEKSVSTQTTSETSTLAQPTSKISTLAQATSEISTLAQTMSETSTLAQTNFETSPLAHLISDTSISPETASEISTSCQTNYETSTLAQEISGTSALSPTTSETSTLAKTSSETSTLTQLNSETSTLSNRTSEASAQTTSETSAFSQTTFRTSISAQETSESFTVAHSTSEISTLVSTAYETSTTAQSITDTSALVQATPETSTYTPTNSETSPLTQVTSDTSVSTEKTTEISTSSQLTSKTSTLAQENSETSTLGQVTSQSSISAETTSEISTSCQTNSETSTLAQETSGTSALAPATSEISSSAQTPSKKSTLFKETSDTSTFSETTSETSVLPQVTSDTSISGQTTSETSASYQTASNTSRSVQTTSETSTLVQVSSETSTFTQTTSEPSNSVTNVSYQTSSEKSIFYQTDLTSATAETSSGTPLSTVTTSETYLVTGTNSEEMISTTTETSALTSYETPSLVQTTTMTEANETTSEPCYSFEISSLASVNQTTTEISSSQKISETSTPKASSTSFQTSSEALTSVQTTLENLETTLTNTETPTEVEMTLESSTNTNTQTSTVGKTNLEASTSVQKTSEMLTTAETNFETATASMIHSETFTSTPAKFETSTLHPRHLLTSTLSQIPSETTLPTVTTYETSATTNSAVSTLVTNETLTETHFETPTSIPTTTVSETSTEITTEPCYSTEISSLASTKEVESESSKETSKSVYETSEKSSQVSSETSTLFQTSSMAYMSTQPEWKKSSEISSSTQQNRLTSLVVHTESETSTSEISVSEALTSSVSVSTTHFSTPGASELISTNSEMYTSAQTSVSSPETILPNTSATSISTQEMSSETPSKNPYTWMTTPGLNNVTQCSDECLNSWSCWSVCPRPCRGIRVRIRTYDTENSSCLCDDHLLRQEEPCTCWPRSTTISLPSTTLPTCNCTHPKECTSCFKECKMTCRGFRINATCQEHDECTHGCKCPEGQLMDDNGFCTSPSRCPCYNTKGGKVNFGARYIDPFTCKVCYCNENGHLCEDKRTDFSLYDDWSEWSGWSSCSSFCGSGTSTRYRTGDYQGCSTKQEESKSCSSKECLCVSENGMLVQEGHSYKPDDCHICQCINGQFACETDENSVVDGKWEEWSLWSPCEKNCSLYHQSVSRYCKPPVCGGKPCVGSSMESRVCSTEPCCHVYTWSDWGQCNQTCGLNPGYRTRYKIYADELATDKCGEHHESEECGLCDCSDKEASLSWTQWTSCTKNGASCGWGKRYRDRTVSDQCAENKVDSSQTENCFLGPCNCSNGLVWSNHSLCQQTCKKERPPACSLQLFGDCICPDELVSDGQNCVPFSNCSVNCVYNSVFYQEGQHFSCDNCKTCHCTRGQIHKVDRKCPNVRECNMNTHHLVPSEDGCCLVDCVPQETCRVQKGQAKYITVDKCTSSEKVDQQVCGGPCQTMPVFTDYTGKYMGAMECLLCRPKITVYKAVTFQCENHTSIIQPVPLISECECK